MIVLGSSSGWRVLKTPLKFSSIEVGFVGQRHMCDYTESRRGDDSGITGIIQLREVAHCEGSRIMGPTVPYRVHGRVGLRQITVMQPRMRLYTYI